jgi:CBS domain-containing protein
MLRVRDIMTVDPLTVSPEMNVREAMELLANRHVSGAPVMVGDEVVGVVSTTDLMGFAASLPGVPTEREVNDEWGELAESSTADDVDHEVEPASAYFTDLWDDAGAEVTGRIANIDSPEWNALEEHQVSEVMTRSPLVVVGPDAAVEEAAALMRKRGIHRVLVVGEGGRLVGIVTALDIAAVASTQPPVRRVHIFNRDQDFRE